jgi:hypothetical protein
VGRQQISLAFEVVQPESWPIPPQETNADNFWAYLRHLLPISVVSVSSQSGHSLGEEVRYKALGIALINAMIFRVDCWAVKVPSAAGV